MSGGRAVSSRQHWWDIGERTGPVGNRRKLAKHLTLYRRLRRAQGQIDEEALLDGTYALRSQGPEVSISPAAVVRAYKQLKVNERASRQIKTPLEIRRSHLRVADRVRAYALLCMLATTSSASSPTGLSRCCSTTTRRSRPPACAHLDTNAALRPQRNANAWAGP
jgi:hypothetical protein